MTGAKGLAPSCDYKVKEWEEPGASLQQPPVLTFVHASRCVLPTWMVSGPRLSAHSQDHVQ